MIVFFSNDRFGFNIEVSVEVDSSSYPTGYEYEDINPHRDYSKILNNE